MDGRGSFVLVNDSAMHPRLPSRATGGVNKNRIGQEVKLNNNNNNNSVDKLSKTLPAISAASPQSSQYKQQQQNQSLQQFNLKSSDSLKNPLALLASESRATAIRNTTQEKWRSALLGYEVELKELVTNDMEAPPTDIRLKKTFHLYDAVTRIVEDQSPELADLLKMFRLEFSRATFARRSLNEAMPHWGDNNNNNNNNNELEEEDAAEELGMTYFEQVSALLRENAALRVEVSLGNTRDNVALLNQQIKRLKDMVAYYENEVNRLERENERSAESYRKARSDLEEQKKNSRNMMDKFDDEKQRLLQENKDMQLRLCRLRKYLSDKESTTIKDTYRYLKGKKMDVMAKLFDEGDEKVSILVMLSQLESRVNEALDEYDREMLLCEESELHERQKRMLSVVSVLLEEMHLSEERYLRLVPNGNTLSGEEHDETDGYVSLLRDPKLYEALVARVEARSGKKELLGNLTTTDGGEEETETEAALASTIESRINTSIMESKELDFAASYAPSSIESSVRPLLSSQIVFTQHSPQRQSQEQKQQKEKEEKEKEEKQLQGVTEQPVNTQQANASSEQTLTVQVKEASPEAIAIVKKKQEEWVANIFGNAVEMQDLLQRAKKSGNRSDHITDQERLLQYFISQPMLDVSHNKFQCGIDIYAGPGPLTQAFLCSVMHIDPVSPLHVPQGTNFMHVKYRNPLRREVAREDVEMASNINPNAAEALEEWGGRTSFVREEISTNTTNNNNNMNGDGTFQHILPDLANKTIIFNELRQPEVMKSAGAGVAVISSSTPVAITFERLNPLSPNRSPEWLLYQSLFGGYRPLTPRLIDISYIDHILLNSCERHFDRAEERYLRCLKQARGRATNSQMAINMTERFFRESSVLTDFQESIIRELESRYCYPELVAKTLYEILCFLDATMAAQPLVDLYLSCIRGFESPTRIHYITYVLYQLSINWPSSNPEETVLQEDVLTLLEHIYKKASSVASMDAGEILTEYKMATRSAPITLTSLRNYLVTAMLHFEDPLLLYFNGLLSYKATSSSVVEMNYEQFEFALKDKWEEKIEGKLFVRYLAASCGFNKKAELTTRELACVATSMWSSQMWANM